VQAGQAGQAGRGEYPSEYHRMVVTGLVDHDWAARLQYAATGQSAESIADVLAERGFSSSAELEAALRNVDWGAIRAVAQAFAPERALGAQMIC
jgi:hypothetical protein